tara:strand:+ start:40 stop:693 length:654 start_codon:yes stop_codon:yes gene_type:complete
MKKEKVKQILEKLYQVREDFQMLHDDVWVPDEDSCNASIENVESIISLIFTGFSEGVSWEKYGEIIKGEMVFVNSEGGLVAEVIKIQDINDVLVKFVGEGPNKWLKYGYYKLNELQHAEYNQNDDKYYSKDGYTYAEGGEIKTNLSKLKKGDKFYFPLDKDDEEIGRTNPLDAIYVFNNKIKSTYHYSSKGSKFSTSTNRGIVTLPKDSTYEEGEEY